MVHIGQQIKQRAEKQKVGSAELAVLINTSKQNVNSIYKRASIDTDLLRDISIALNFNFFILYELPIANPLTSKIAELEKNNATLTKELKHLKEQIELLKQVNVLLDKADRKKK